MHEITENSNHNSSILLERNHPVALVVGAASFFGSHLVDSLLSKNVQVVGVDDLKIGKRENLSEASENRDFHLIIDSGDNLNLDLERLDYIFIVPQQEFKYGKIFDLFKTLKSRLLLISSIELYDKESVPGSLKWLKKVESDVAQTAKEGDLNARVLRLGPVFGPRMDFHLSNVISDPIIRLIQQALSGDLQKDTSQEFSSRALYVDDACTLAVKCIFAGATAQKVFDGILLTPIKVAEIKQVLLDPVWYETKQFEPSELPPWPTPNLEKTLKFLNWHPHSKLVPSLRETLSYFKDHDIEVPKLEGVKRVDEKWKEEKASELEALRGEKDKKGEVIPKVKEKGSRKKKFKLPIFPVVILIFVFFALIWPFAQVGWGILTFKFQLSEAVKDLERGDFDKSLFAIKQANNGVVQAKSIFQSLDPIRSTNILKSQFEAGDSLINLATLSADSAQNTILGVQSLYQSLKSITGESSESPKSSFNMAQTYLASADEDLSKADALINAVDFKANLPGIFKSSVDNLSSRLSMYSNLVKKARALSILLPDVVALEGSKNYLVLLQNNNELRPTGGFIGSFARVGFENGKLKKLEVNDTYAIDGQLKLHVEPPKELKSDLGQNDYYLRDANWEPDFPTSARQVEWFYTKETGERVEGVIALDISAIEDLLKAVGPLDLADYNEKISSDNLFERSITHAETNFFPGTQAKKSFLAALTQGLFNKLFFLPNQNWPAIVTSLGRSMESKHMSVYLNNPSLFSYLISQNWASVLPRPNIATQSGLVSDLLAPVEANLGANKANYYLDRSYNLETTIGKDGEISHRLRISYTNRSPSDTFPAGTYKDRMRVYLPNGSKLNKALWAETDITKDVAPFTDYGRSGYSMFLALKPKEQKVLVLDFISPQKLEFKDNVAGYRLDVVKQAGTLKDPFVWRITYPISMKITSGQATRIGPQEQTIQTDLSVDRSFQVQFQK